MARDGPAAGPLRRPKAGQRGDVLSQTEPNQRCDHSPEDSPDRNGHGKTAERVQAVFIEIWISQRRIVCGICAYQAHPWVALPVALRCQAAERRYANFNHFSHACTLSL